MDFKNIKVDYKKFEINFKDLDSHPVDFFLKWFSDILEINKEANACVLSTVSHDNKPSSRVVLLKDVSKKGFVFFTNYQSDKSIDIEDNNYVALNFYWSELERQVRIRGKAERISAEESDIYFKRRPRESQMGACLSNQSSSIDLDYDFTDELEVLRNKFKGKEVNRPSHWGGYYIMPNQVEFWQGRPSRLHDRLLYEFNGESWDKKRLAP